MPNEWNNNAMSSSTSTTVFSESLQQEITLIGDALLFYNGCENSADYFHDEDPNFFNALVDLGYNYYLHRELFEETEPLAVWQIVEYKIPPAMAKYASYFLRLGDTELSEDIWLAKAVSIADVDKAIRNQLEGWDKEFAIVLAAFPERTNHLQEIFHYGLEYQASYLSCDYNVSMLSRLNKIPHADHINIIELLDKGYTENEIKDYGIYLTRYFTPNEIRSSAGNPTALKNIFSLFNNFSPYNTSNQYFIPTVNQLDSLNNAGIKSGKQYQEITRKLSINSLDKETLPAVIDFMNK